ncbi:Patatin [Ceratocystis platani]|uniref:Patatin n=1 Tax=Ceratocystis fimbriata f. sp. platani TaxID=88771 RepID=A0A0F8AYW6_CERFI|nr:Patatin [Ceratocystis platani]
MDSVVPTFQLPKILSLDGGGVRCLSSLLILENIMERIRDVANLAEIPRPCEIFDLIGGSGAGGIIAIMLGRLGMSIGDCIEAYKNLAETAFNPKRPRFILPSGAFSAARLEHSIKQTIRENCLESTCVEQRKTSGPTTHTCPHEDVSFHDISCTKTAILAITKANVETLPTLFTTYDTSSSLSGSKVWEVARATSADVAFFKPIRVGRDQIEFVDASFGYSNPCEDIIIEAEKQFPGQQMVILSIGTGLGDVVPIGDTKDSAIAALKDVIASSKAPALRLEKKYKNTGEYYRFSVENGLRDISLLDSDKMSTISAHARNYLIENEDEIRDFVEVLTNRVPPAPTNPGG